MEAEKLEATRRELINLRADLERQLAEMRDELPGGRSANPDRSDLARTYDQLQRQTALEERLEGRLDQVNNALQRIDEGVYGICENCGNPIASERLEALPEATLCVDCQAKQR